uniref:Glutathione-dependent formaldehyde-activating, GFA n=1 Tax=uncultured bacterium ws406H10 TaxID=1131831 RepID=I1X5H1_9BACT|nr:glutathione-dependent formaldehyde-activating, GFA [uncultured bacterium ws406H10]
MGISESKTFDGGCTCGAVRYRMISNPLFVHCCHCSWCQRETGSAFVLNALIESDRVEVLQGSLQRVMTPSASGEGQKIFRCPDCQIAVWSNYATAVGDRMRFVRVGTLDAPGRLPPDIHIFTVSKPDWLELPTGIPAVEQYYDRRIFWPEASLARYSKLKTRLADDNLTCPDD